MSDLRPGWWATAEWWADEDGRHAWFAHDCVRERVETMLPFPTWRIVDDQRGSQEVNPSVSCDECGLHTFLLSVDRALNPSEPATLDSPEAPR